MRVVPVLLALTLTACHVGSTEQQYSPPRSFPDLTEFRAVDIKEYNHTGRLSFYNPDQQINCTLDWGDEKAVICNGFSGTPPAGAGCAYVRKSDGDAEYRFRRSERTCVTAKSVRPMPTGRKIVGENATCLVDGDVVACIDKDNRHGFVLQPADSWTF